MFVNDGIFIQIPDSGDSEFLIVSGIGAPEESFTFSDAYPDHDSEFRIGILTPRSDATRR